MIDPDDAAERALAASVPPSDAYLSRWHADLRRRLGQQPQPPLPDDMPADLRAILM